MFGGLINASNDKDKNTKEDECVSSRSKNPLLLPTELTSLHFKILYSTFRPTEKLRNSVLIFLTIFNEQLEELQTAPNSAHLAYEDLEWSTYRNYFYDASRWEQMVKELSTRMIQKKVKREDLDTGNMLYNRFALFELSFSQDEIEVGNLIDQFILRVFAVRSIVSSVSLLENLVKNAGKNKPKAGSGLFSFLNTSSKDSRTKDDEQDKSSQKPDSEEKIVDRSRGDKHPLLTILLKNKDDHPIVEEKINPNPSKESICGEDDRLNIPNQDERRLYVQKASEDVASYSTLDNNNKQEIEAEDLDIEIYISESLDLDQDKNSNQSPESSLSNKRIVLEEIEDDTEILTVEHREVDHQLSSSQDNQTSFDTDTAVVQFINPLDLVEHVGVLKLKEELLKPDENTAFESRESETLQNTDSIFCKDEILEIMMPNICEEIVANEETFNYEQNSFANTDAKVLDTPEIMTIQKLITIDAIIEIKQIFCPLTRIRPQVELPRENSLVQRDTTIVSQEIEEEDIKSINQAVIDLIEVPKTSEPLITETDEISKVHSIIKIVNEDSYGKDYKSSEEKTGVEESNQSHQEIPVFYNKSVTEKVDIKTLELNINNKEIETIGDKRYDGNATSRIDKHLLSHDNTLLNIHVENNSEKVTSCGEEFFLIESPTFYDSIKRVDSNEESMNYVPEVIEVEYQHIEQEIDKVEQISKKETIEEFGNKKANTFDNHIQFDSFEELYLRCELSNEHQVLNNITSELEVHNENNDYDLDPNLCDRCSLERYNEFDPNSEHSYEFARKVNYLSSTSIKNTCDGLEEKGPKKEISIIQSKSSVFQVDTDLNKYNRDIKTSSEKESTESICITQKVNPPQMSMNNQDQYQEIQYTCASSIHQEEEVEVISELAHSDEMMIEEDANHEEGVSENESEVVGCEPSAQNCTEEEEIIRSPTCASSDENGICNMSFSYCDVSCKMQSKFDEIRISTLTPQSPRANDMLIATSPEQQQWKPSLKNSSDNLPGELSHLEDAKYTKEKLILLDSELFPKRRNRRLIKKTKTEARKKSKKIKKKIATDGKKLVPKQKVISKPNSIDKKLRQQVSSNSFIKKERKVKFEGYGVAPQEESPGRVQCEKKPAVPKFKHGGKTKKELETIFSLVRAKSKERASSRNYGLASTQFKKIADTRCRILNDLKSSYNSKLVDEFKYYEIKKRESKLALEVSNLRSLSPKQKPELYIKSIKCKSRVLKKSQSKTRKSALLSNRRKTINKDSKTHIFEVDKEELDLKSIQQMIDKRLQGANCRPFRKTNFKK